MAAPSEQKIVAIHQPNYFPWLGFFHKIYACDIFVFHDNVEHSKRYPTRRTRIRQSAINDETCWLTVPLKKHSDFALLKDLEIDQKQAWPEMHLRKLKNTYYNAPFFKSCIGEIEAWFAQAHSINSLSDCNIFFIKCIMASLNSEKTCIRSSELEAYGNGSLTNFAIVNLLGGASYLSGKGGAGYQVDSDFFKNNIRLINSDFGAWLTKNPYQQYQGGSFNGGLSILDSLFNIGIEGVQSILRSAYQISQNK